MAPVGRDGPPRRPGPSLRGVAVFYTLAGKPVVRKWPRARGKARTQVEQQRRDWFARANRAWRYVWSGEQNTAQTATAGSPLQPRDLHLMAWSGRLFRISFKDGSQMVSQATRMGVSQSLDALEAEDGDVLGKVGDEWKGVKVSGGAAAWVWNQDFGALNTNTSGSGYAFKGGRWAVYQNAEITGVAATFSGAAGGTYRMAICEIDGANKVTAVVLSSLHTPSLSARIPTFFSLKTTLIAGKSYAIMAGRTDQGGSYGFPCAFTQAGHFNLPFRLLGAARLATTEPAIGQTINTAGGASDTIPIGLQVTL